MLLLSYLRSGCQPVASVEFMNVPNLGTGTKTPRECLMQQACFHNSKKRPPLLDATMQFVAKQREWITSSHFTCSTYGVLLIVLMFPLLVFQ